MKHIPRDRVQLQKNGAASGCLRLLAFLACGSGLLAQSLTSSLVGSIKDATGAIVPNAVVTASNLATNMRVEARSDARSGEYILLNLLPGSYSVEVSAKGFQKYVQTGVILQLEQQARLNVSLQIGDLAQTVMVEANASALETTKSTVGDVVDNHTILNAPLNTRNIYSLLFLTPGVSGSIGNDYNSLSYSVNGARSSFMEHMVDGVSGGHPTVQGYTAIAVFPPVDAIDEFKVEGENYPAEYGRSIANVTNIIYKSGTNVFHGTAYDFLRNSVLDATDYFSNAHSTPLLSFKRNQFGGVLHGPIRKNRTFFLVSVDELRQRSFSSVTTTVPTLLQRQGDFSQTFAANGQQVKIFDPFTTTLAGGVYTRSQFSNNVIPTSRLNPVAVKLSKYYPLPNTAGNAVTNANNYYASGADSSNIDSWDVKIDHNITDRQRFFGRYSNRVYETVPAELFPSDIVIGEGLIKPKDYMRNIVTGYTYSLSPTLVLDIRGGFARTLYLYQNEGVGFHDSSLGLPANLDTAGYLAMFPVVSTGGYVTLGNGGNRRNAFMTYSATSSLTKVAGRHTYKMGWEGRMIRVNDHEYNDTSGNFSFAASSSQGPNASTASSTAGNGYASQLLGVGSGDVIQNFKDDASQSFYHALYLQDDWRVTRTLTLNLGLRYDIDSPRTERYNRMNYFDPAVASPLASAIPNLKGGLIFVGVNGNSRYQFPWETTKFAPRFGFAWSADNKTVVRGGFGLVYGPSAQQASGTVGPFGWRVQTNWVSSLDGYTPYDTFSNPFPGGFSPAPAASQGLLTSVGSSIQGWLQETYTPYTTQWNFNVQRSLPMDTTLRVGYVGNRGLQLMRNAESGLDLDQINPAYLSLGTQLNKLVDNPFYGKISSGALAASQVSLGQLLRPYPQYTSIIPLYSSGDSSNYHSLQVRFNKRFSHGLQFGGSYVWSKAIDEGTNHQDSYSVRGDRAISSIDIPQRFVVSYTYEIPFGRGRHFGTNANALVDSLLGGWQMNGITTIQNSTPLSVSATNVAGLGNPTERANNNGQSPVLTGDIHDRLNRYFNTSVFSQPAAYTFGNTSAYLSSLRGQNTNNTDFSIFKEVRVFERFRLQLRAEAFNALNHVRFGNPNTSVTSASFGVISSQANTPRQVQVALKLLF